MTSTKNKRNLPTYNQSVEFEKFPTFDLKTELKTPSILLSKPLTINLNREGSSRLAKLEDGRSTKYRRSSPGL